MHGPVAASEAAAHFDRVVVQGRAPQEIEELTFDGRPGTVHLPALLADAFGGSRGEARRLLAQGGVRLNGQALGPADQDMAADRLDGGVLQAGRRRFRRLRRT